MPQQYAVIATPSYDGSVQDLCAGSVAEAVRTCLQARIYTAWMIKSGSPYLPLVRNKLVYEFLQVPQATDLVFVDADVGFDAAALPRLLSYDADVVGGCYPFKSDAEGYPLMIDWAKTGVPKARTVARHDGQGAPLEEGALVECLMLPTGFLRIRRTALERYIEHFGEDELLVIEYEPDGTEGGRYLEIFKTPREGRRWFGEDVWFCREWREALGGQVLLDPDINFSHSGRKHWRGNYHTYRRRLPGGDLHEPAPEPAGDALRQAAGNARELLKPATALLETLQKARPAKAGMKEAAPGNGSEATLAPPFERGPELLLGCGRDWRRKVGPRGLLRTPQEFTELTALDGNVTHRPHVVHDLEALPYPFEDDQFAEVHAYEVLEHIGAQGDWQAFFAQFSELWRILRPGGLLCGTVPWWQSEWAWGDPSHRRVITPASFTFLSQEQYRQQVGVTAMSDFRFCYQADFVLRVLEKDVRGMHLVFVLEAVKPSTYREADLTLQAAQGAGGVA